MKRVALFASGSGTNAQKIFEYFETHTEIEIGALYSNKADALVLQRAESFSVSTKVFDRDTFYNTEAILEDLKDRKIDFIALAGFLWLMPSYLVEAYPDKIINIHPALLPKYGGKGMYGMKVHETIVQNKEKETGITIHYVNEKYDEGNIVLQAKCSVLPQDTPQKVAEKVHELEYLHFAKVIEQLVLEM